MSLPKITPRTIAELESLYARLPRVACRRLCGDACGPMILTDLEARRLQVATHTKPRTLPMVTTPADMRCIYLSPKQDRCTAYDVRPLICRVWGVVKRLSCPRGCVPDRWLSDREFLDIAQAVERLGGGRVLRTAPEGLAHQPGESFARLGDPERSYPRADAEIDAEAERVRNLRALFGGRILTAIRNREEP